MASKTLANGKKVLVGSKADPDSKSYTPRSTTSSPSTYDTLEQVETRATELIGQRDTPTSPERTPRYTSTNSNSAPSSARIYNTDGSYSYAAPAPKSAEQIQKEMMRSAQGEVNALRDYENTLLDEQKVINEKNDRSTAAVNTLTGMAGSTEANIKQQETTAKGQKANDAIRAEVALKMQALLGNVRQSAVAEARAQREEARLDEETRLKNRAARQQEAATQLTNLAAGGVTFEGLKTASPKEFAYLASQFGGEEALKGAFVLNTPKDQVLSHNIVNGHMVISKQNPITGKITTEAVDLGIPPQLTERADLGNAIMFYDPSDPTKQYIVPKGLTPSQQQSSSSPSPTNALVDSNGKPIKMTAAQTDAIASFDTTMQTSNDALALVEGGVETGPIAAAKLQAAKLMNNPDPDQLRLEQMLAKIKADFMKALSGAAVSEQEAKRLAKFLPDIFDQEEVIKSKLQNLASEVERSKSNLLRTLGATDQTNEGPTGDSLRIKVRLSNGQTGTIDESEYDPSSMTKI